MTDGEMAMMMACTGGGGGEDLLGRGGGESGGDRREWGEGGGRGMCCRHRTFLLPVFPTSRPPRKLRCSSPCNVYVQVGNASGETWPRSAQPAQSLLRCGIKLVARAVSETPVQYPSALVKGLVFCFCFCFLLLLLLFLFAACADTKFRMPHRPGGGSI